MGDKGGDYLLWPTLFCKCVLLYTEDGVFQIVFQKDTDVSRS
jgi:hypothetical protein